MKLLGTCLFLSGKRDRDGTLPVDLTPESEWIALIGPSFAKGGFAPGRMSIISRLGG